MTKELKTIPTFESEDEERAFWAAHDSTEYIDWDEAEAIVLPKLKPSTKTISTPLTGVDAECIKKLGRSKHKNEDW
jgi:hypothetical protein